MDENEIRQKVLSVLQELNGDIDYETEEALVDDQLLDSFDLAEVMPELGEQFDVEITAKDFVPENFNSADGLVRMIARLLDE